MLARKRKWKWIACFEGLYERTAAVGWLVSMNQWDGAFRAE
jgi:hypothetical protein